jgi:hypothetical protein
MNEKNPPTLKGEVKPMKNKLNSKTNTDDNKRVPADKG